MQVEIKKKKIDWKKYIFVGSVLAYPLALFLLMYVYVNINSFVMAFQSSNIDGSKIFVGFNNFKDFISRITEDGGLLRVSLINSLKMYIINFAICMPLYIFFSYLLFKHVFAEKFLRVLIMVPQVLSGMIVALLFKKFIDNAFPDIMKNIFNLQSFPLLLTEKQYAFGTTLFYMIWISFGTNVIVYSNAMNGIDPEIIESAKIDGIDNMFLELWHIILPLIYPTLTTFIVTGFASILTNGGVIMTFYYNASPSYLYNMGYYYSVQIINGNTATYNMLAAGGLIMTLLVAPATNLLKYLMEKYGPGVE